MPHPKNQISHVCPNCGKEFTRKASLKQTYCAMACRTAHKIFMTECAQCGKQFMTYRANAQKYCSISCGLTARNLTDKNPSYHRDVTGENNPMFGKRRMGPENPMYGRFKENCQKTRKDGYVMVKAPNGHPHPSDVSSGTAYILKHRLIMEQSLGRYLDPTEVIHHIDGDPRNNDIRNLSLFTNQSTHISMAHPYVRCHRKQPEL